MLPNEKRTLEDSLIALSLSLEGGYACLDIDGNKIFLTAQEASAVSSWLFDAKIALQNQKKDAK